MQIHAIFNNIKDNASFPQAQPHLCWLREQSRPHSSFQAEAFWTSHVHINPWHLLFCYSLPDQYDYQACNAWVFENMRRTMNMDEHGTAKKC